MDFGAVNLFTKYLQAFVVVQHHSYYLLFITGFSGPGGNIRKSRLWSDWFTRLRILWCIDVRKVSNVFLGRRSQRKNKVYSYDRVTFCQLVNWSQTDMQYWKANTFLCVIYNYSREKKSFDFFIILFNFRLQV